MNITEEEREKRCGNECQYEQKVGGNEIKVSRIKETNGLEI